MDLVPIFIILKSFTRLTLDFYFVYVTSSCKTLPTRTLSSLFIFSSLFLDSRVSWLLEVLFSTPLRLVLSYNLNAVDYLVNRFVDFLRYDGTGQCELALRCEYTVKFVL